MTIWRGSCSAIWLSFTSCYVYSTTIVWKKKNVEKILSYSLSNERPGSEQMVSLTDAFLNKPGFGNRCMKNQPLP